MCILTLHKTKAGKQQTGPYTLAFKVSHCLRQTAQNQWRHLEPDTGCVQEYHPGNCKHKCYYFCSVTHWSPFLIHHKLVSLERIRAHLCLFLSPCTFCVFLEYPNNLASFCNTVLKIATAFIPYLQKCM